jgi:hypothetical protein
MIITVGGVLIMKQSRRTAVPMFRSGLQGRTLPITYSYTELRTLQNPGARIQWFCDFVISLHERIS